MVRICVGINKACLENIVHSIILAKPSEPGARDGLCTTVLGVLRAHRQQNKQHTSTFPSG